MKVAPQVKTGFYETPPVARRHLAKPLVRWKNNKDVYPSR
jgi:tRNA(Ile2) C34 agmatinyltransferase TiaS